MVAFVGVTDSGYAGRSGSVTSSVPGGVTDGDLLILAVLLGNGSGAIYPVTPSGWTQFAGMPSSVNDISGFTVTTSLYWRIASSEPASYVVDYEDFSHPSNAAMFAYSGVGSTPDITVATGVGPTVTLSGMTAAVDGTRFALIAHNWTAAGGFTPPSGSTPTWTERLDASGSLFYAADGVLNSGEATGDDTLTFNNAANEPWTAILLALEPPVAAVSTGDVAAQESGADTAAIAGDVVVQGALAVQGAGIDACAIAGRVLVQGAIAAQESGADRASIHQTHGTSEALTYAVAANDLRYSVAVRGLGYSVAARDLRFSVPAQDLRYSVPAR